MTTPTEVTLSPRATRSRSASLPAFLDLSAAITGFGVFRLEATGQAESYLAQLRSVVGDEIVDDLLARFRGIADAAVDPAHVERALRVEVLGDPRLGPVTRHLIKLWFVGTWYQLPRDWHAAYGRADGGDRDETRVVSPAAYVEGLLWPTIGANPPGAKAPGYGTWADPPRIPDA